ncbi:Kinesin-related protein 6 [Diplonema papillatum]|nr:Kinesin-related protein 6 [Diplonema papillatum]
MYCRNCKADRGGKFCPDCGSKLLDRAEEPPNSARGGVKRTSGAGAGSAYIGAAPGGGSLRDSLPNINRAGIANPPCSPPARAVVPGASPQRPRPDADSIVSTSVASLREAKLQQQQQQQNATQPMAQGPVPTDAAALVAAQRSPNTRKRDAMVSSSSSGQNRITVAVRKKPLMPHESPLDVINVSSLNGLTVCEPKKALDGTPLVECHKFLFDEVFDERDNNQEVYQRTARRLIDYVYDGGFCAVFAYGQTGSGKSYTMLGSDRDAQPGLYLQAAEEIFAKIEPNLEVAVSFFEIYAAKLYDLLNGKEQVYSREDENQKVHIRGLTEHKVKNTSLMMALIKKGMEGRSQSSTTMNDESSRSHAIMEIKLKLSSGKLIGKLSVIDLAGSERAAVGHAGDKQVQMEGAEINKSLLALKECIRALDQGARHVPFRQSELTQILKESFLGESGHTTMIANITASHESCPETINTLRYAYRLKELKADEAAPAVPNANPGANLIRNAQGALITDRKEKPTCPGCGAERRNLASLEAHKESCELVVVSCRHCPASYKRKDAAKHEKTCPRLPVECRLCKQKYPRDVLKKHQQFDCPNGETSCLFCRVKLTRAELEGHKGTCEQRTVECECGAKVKFSQLQNHKKTCKKVKKDSIVSASTDNFKQHLHNANGNAANGSAIAAGPTPVQKDVEPTSQPPSRTNSNATSMRHSSTSEPVELKAGCVQNKPQPSTSGKRSSSVTATAKPTPNAAKPLHSSAEDIAKPVERRQTTTDVSSDDPAAAAPTTVVPAPPAGRRSFGSNAGGSKPQSPVDMGGSPPICGFGEMGCSGVGCGSEAHVQLLLGSFVLLKKENADMKKEFAVLNHRLAKIEHHNEQLRRLHTTAALGAGNTKATD